MCRAGLRGVSLVPLSPVPNACGERSRRRLELLKDRGQHVVVGLGILDNELLEGVCEGLLEPYGLRQSLMRAFVGARFSCQSGSDWQTRAAGGVASLAGFRSRSLLGKLVDG